MISHGHDGADMLDHSQRRGDLLALPNTRFNVHGMHGESNSTQSVTSTLNRVRGNKMMRFARERDDWPTRPCTTPCRLQPPLAMSICTHHR
jgi:hypothetical protein